MSIYKINPALPLTNKLIILNQMIMELNGLVSEGKFDINEVTNIYEQLGAERQFVRNAVIGGSVTSYVNWSHLSTQDGYSIWKYVPTHYLYNEVNQLYLDDVILENRGLAFAESLTAFDSVFLYNGDSGSGYVDNSTEAGTEGGTNFDVMNTAHDYLYLGASAAFSGIKFDWKTRGSNYNLVIQYWNSSSWSTLSVNSNNLDESTNNFQSDGHITWDLPSDWSTTSVNSQSKYWIRIYTSTNPITTASAYTIAPNSSVIGLLAMSSTELLNEGWAWCSYNSAVYVTIKNSGSGSFEGISYITSSSTDTNKKNFFVYNHQFTANHEDSTYTASPISLGGSGSGTLVLVSVMTSTSVSTSTDMVLADASIGDITLSIFSAYNRSGRQLTVKKKDSSAHLVNLDFASGETADGTLFWVLGVQYQSVTLVSDGHNWQVIG